MGVLSHATTQEHRYATCADKDLHTIVDNDVRSADTPEAAAAILVAAQTAFLYADALARSGHRDEARLTFSKMLTYANHVGLYSEEISATGEQIGNFPQAFTHLALITAALSLESET